MEHLINLFNQFNTYAKANPILAGVASLWGAGVVTWLLRGVPLKIWAFLKHQGTTTLTMDNSRIGTNFETYNSFVDWLQQSKWMKYSRSMSVSGTEIYTEDTGTKEGSIVGIGAGTHFFTYKGWPYWVTRSQLQAGQATTQVMWQVVITGVGRNRQRLLDMIEDFRYEPDKEKLEIYNASGSRWARIASIIPRSIDSVIVEGGVKEKMIAEIEKYQSKRDWYHERGLPYKLTFALHGPTGTGKTSLIKALATKFGKSICVLALANTSDSELTRLLANMPRNSALLIEDFDSASAVAKRDGVEGEEPDPSGKKPTSLADQKFSMLTLSGILNAFDGIVSLDDRLIFMTTNVIDKIDPAMIRPGRVDHVIEIGLLKDSTIRQYIAMMFPGQSAPTGEFAPIAGCYLQAKYLEFSEDYDAFVASIPRKVPRVDWRDTLKAA